MNFSLKKKKKKKNGIVTFEDFKTKTIIIIINTKSTEKIRVER